MARRAATVWKIVAGERNRAVACEKGRNYCHGRRVSLMPETTTPYRFGIGK